MLAASKTLAGGVRLRLSLKDAVWLTSAATLAANLYEILASRSSVFAIAQPSSAYEGVWTQDVQVKEGLGVYTVAQLVQSVQSLGVKVVDARELKVAELGVGDTVAEKRDQEAKGAGEKYRKQNPDWWTRFQQWMKDAGDVLKWVRALGALALIAVFVWFTWPWWWPMLRGLRARKKATS